jgi:glycosyltransferase involved in cell wall biosynthesis
MRAEVSETTVSVIITTCNVEQYVAAAIRSALDQSYSDYELIVADDGSVDGTLQVVRNFRDSRISVLAFPHRGPTWVLNECIARSRGRYIAFLDGDDIWASERLERHVHYMDAHPEADLSFSLSRIIDEEGKDTGMTTRSFRGPVPFERLLADNLVANGSAVMIRRTAAQQVGLFDTEMAASYDHDYWLRLALLRPGNIASIPEVLTFYRRRPGQITKDWRLMERASHYMVEKLRQMHPSEIARTDGCRRGNLYRYLAMIAFENGTYEEGLRLLCRSAVAAPVDFLVTPRSYQTALALTAGVILPPEWLGGLAKSARALFCPAGDCAIHRSNYPQALSATAIPAGLQDLRRDNQETEATA